MQSILDFLKGIGDAFLALIDFIVALVADLIYLVQLVGETMVALPDYFSWLPSTVTTSILLIISIVIIYKVLGREG